MSVETLTDLNAETLDAVEQLIQVNVDSRDGFREAAKLVADPEMEELFGAMAENRKQNALALKSYAEHAGESPRTEGSYAAALHRLWLDLRGKISGGDPKAILAEAERGEDFIKSAYEVSLKATSGSAVNDVLLKQYAEVKSQHDRVRDLRDTYASNAG